MNKHQRTTNQPSNAPESVKTLLQAVSHHCKIAPNFQAVTWVDVNCQEADNLTYKELDDRSNAVAAHLLKLGCKKGDRVMIAYPFGLDFLAGLFGCMKIGVIGCSIYPPNPKNIKSDVKKFRTFVEDAGAEIALSTNLFASAMKAVGLVYKLQVKWIGTDGLSRPSSTQIKSICQAMNSLTGKDIAFIQYTSGSTGNPKGVVIHHEALLENTKALSSQAETIPGKTVAVLWVPQYHDMGLVSGFMSALYSGISLIMASPLDFVSRPILWSDMVEKYKADLTCAPNFAYALVIKRLEQAGRTADWSHVKQAMFGGEPTQDSVVSQVIEVLSVKPEHVYQCYGMAESVVFLTGGIAEIASDGLVSCGPAESATVTLCIVDNGVVLPEGEVGTIWAQSPRVATGYFGKQEATKLTFQNTLAGYDGFWLNTGDLGKIVQGKLYVTGRVKDVIIVNGKNYYPTDVELSIENEFQDTIRPGRSAAFQLTDTTIGLIVEARDRKKVKQSAVAKGISHHILQEHGLDAAKVLVMAPGAAPKTTSGKLKRSEIRSRTVDDTWDKKMILLSHTTEKPADRHEPSSMSNLGEELQLSSNEESTGNQGLPSALAFTIEDAIGNAPDMDLPWEANGIASIKAAELISQIQKDFQVEIPTNFTELYPTPRDLEKFLFSSKGSKFETAEYTNGNPTSTLSKSTLALLQCAGLITIVLLLAMSFLPSFFIGREISKLSTTFEIGNSGHYATWHFLPIVVPIFSISFTIVLICSKYIIVGSYKAEEYQLHSWQYLRWWFVDRLLDMWEVFVGQFILETKVLWLIYRLMGAKIHHSADVNAFMREFDLVEVGPNCQLKHQLRCRKFRHWAINQESPVMVLRPITIGRDSEVSGMLGPGCEVGIGCKVESLSAVGEGSLLPDGAIAQGIPAFNAGAISDAGNNSWRPQLEILKLSWLVVELYLFFGLFLAAQIVINQNLPTTWRYTPLLYWILVLVLAAVFGILVSIVLKWVLIGKRSAGSMTTNRLWSDAATWVCDYHFRLCLLTLLPLSGASFLWMVVLQLHGLDVDYSTIINGIHCFAPSNVDLIKIRRSFLSVPAFDIDAKKGMIEITDSSIAYKSKIYSGVQIVRSSIPPKTAVRESVFDSNQKFFKEDSLKKVALIFTGEIVNVVLAILIFAAFIPSFEVFKNTVYDSSAGVAILSVGATIVTHALSFHLLLRLVEAVTTNSPAFLQRAMFGVYVYHAWTNKVWNLWYLLHGTPMFSVWLRIMGTEVAGDIWYFGSELYDLQKLHFVGDRVVVDDSNLIGHFVLPDSLTIKDTYIRGLVHPGSYAYAGASLSDTEHEPYEVFHSALTEHNSGNHVVACDLNPGTDAESEAWSSGQIQAINSTRTAV